MIRIARPAEPDDLRSARHKRLAHAGLSIHDGTPVNFQDYDPAREPLYRAQGSKCAYCERQQGLEGQPVEHFRPKGGADGRPRHYYWLAWTWRNLLFACTHCNSRLLKGTKFPLADGTAPLPEPTFAQLLAGDGPPFAIESESPLLIDPAREDPQDHIAWLPENPGEMDERLRWRPMFKSVRGEKTIDVFQMRTWLADHVSNHIRGHIWPGIKRLRTMMAINNDAAVHEQWHELLQVLFSELEPFHAASHDALDYWVPEVERTRWSLELKRPGKPPVPDLSNELMDSPKLAKMPDKVRLEARAGRMIADELVLLLCQHDAWTEADLAAATGLALGTIQNARRTLVKKNQLQESSTGYVAISTPQTSSP